VAKKSNIAINKEVVNQIETAYKGLAFKEPEIDIKKDLKEHVDSLESVKEHEREGKVTSWIKGRVNKILIVWKGKYAFSSELLEETDEEIDVLNELKRTEQVNINNTETEIGVVKNLKTRKIKKINDQKREITDTTKIDLNYEKMKSMVLLVFSFSIAIGTYIYFMQSSIDVKWSVISKSEKVAQVKEMILDKNHPAINQYSAFDNYIALDDDDNIIPIDRLKLEDLSGITVENIDFAPTPTLSQFLSHDISILFLSLISFTLILLGKLTAILYEKIKYPIWMFIIAWILASVVLIGAIYTTASLAGEKIRKTVIVDDIQALNIKIEAMKLENMSSFGGGFEDDPAGQVKNPRIIKLEKSIDEKNIELKDSIKYISSFKVITMLLFLFAEVIFGSLGWMVYSEYIAKRNRVNSGGQDKLMQLENELRELETKELILKTNVNESEMKIKEATGLKNKLVAIKSRLYSTADIERIENNYLHAEIVEGKRILQKAEHTWWEKKEKNK